MSRAFVFPGQGAQTIGMGKELADAYPQARAVFDEVDSALDESLSKLIWEGDIDAALNWVRPLPTEGAEALQDETEDIPVFEPAQAAGD